MAISVVVNTYNSSRLIAKVLDAVKEFDEVIVCDMESTDDTVSIARQHGARVVVFPKENYDYCEPARNYAIKQARFEWVLVLNDDEIVTEELRKYLYKFSLKASKAEGLKGLYIPRCNYVIDRFRKSKYPDYKLRFFARDSVNWPPEYKSVPEVAGEVNKIPGSKRQLALIHIPPSLEEMIDSVNRRTNVELKDGRGQRVTSFNILFQPAFRFLDTFVLKGSFRCGVAGLIAAMHDATEEFYHLSKIYESNVRHKIGAGFTGDLPATVVEEKLRRLEEEDERLGNIVEKA